MDGRKIRTRHFSQDLPRSNQGCARLRFCGLTYPQAITQLLRSTTRTAMRISIAICWGFRRKGSVLRTTPALDCPRPVIAQHSCTCNVQPPMSRFTFNTAEVLGNLLPAAVGVGERHQPIRTRLHTLRDHYSVSGCNAKGPAGAWPFSLQFDFLSASSRWTSWARVWTACEPSRGQPCRASHAWPRLFLQELLPRSWPTSSPASRALFWVRL